MGGQEVTLAQVKDDSEIGRKPSDSSYPLLHYQERYGPVSSNS